MTALTATVARYASWTSHFAHTVVARYDERAFDGTQFGRLIALHGDRAAISWDGIPALGEIGPAPRTFEVIDASELAALVEGAESQLRYWGEEAAAEQLAEGAWLRHAESGYDDDPRGW